LIYQLPHEQPKLPAGTIPNEKEIERDPFDSVAVRGETLMTVEEAARRLGLHADTLLRTDCPQGRPIKIGRKLFFFESQIQTLRRYFAEPVKPQLDRVQTSEPCRVPRSRPPASAWNKLRRGYF